MLVLAYVSLQYCIGVCGPTWQLLKHVKNFLVCVCVPVAFGERTALCIEFVPRILLPYVGREGEMEGEQASTHTYTYTHTYA